GTRFGGLPLTLDHVVTTDDAIGGSDTISTAAGSNVVLAGAAGGHVIVGSGHTIALRDARRVDWLLDGDAGDIDRVATASPAVGGDDTIDLGTGDSIVLGGAGDDTIGGGTAVNVVLGDSGEIDASDGTVRFGGLPFTLGSVFTTDDDT